jgi:hypothetical protein
MAGEWQQDDARNGRYTLDDLADWHEMAVVKAENHRRADDAARRRWQQQNGR